MPSKIMVMYHLKKLLWLILQEISIPWFLLLLLLLYIPYIILSIFPPSSFFLFLYSSPFHFYFLCTYGQHIFMLFSLPALSYLFNLQNQIQIMLSLILLNWNNCPHLSTLFKLSCTNQRHISCPTLT